MQSIFNVKDYYIVMYFFSIINKELNQIIMQEKKIEKSED